MKTLLQTLFFFLLVTQICFAQVSWTKYPGNPVLTAPGSWYNGALTPCVLYNADSSRFEMWFSGSAGSGGQRPWKIGYAFSTDGISWNEHPTPVLTPGPATWDSYTVEAPHVIQENGQYKMWYTGSPDFVHFSIGYATSTDGGITWEKYSGNPVFGPGTQFWDQEVGYSSVMPVSGGYKMWYSCTHANGFSEYIGYATSFDGISWERDTLHNPILGPGAAGEWDEFMTTLPKVLNIDNKYYLYYIGGRLQYSQLRVGLAISSDGITNWYKVPENPVLQPTPGQWDGTDVEIGHVVVISDSLYLYYDGQGTKWQIGLAKCKFEPVSVKEEIFQPIEFALEQNYPNPFNPSTIIQYAIGSRQFVSIKVYDLLGREIVTLVNEEKSAGEYEVEFNATNLPSGIYFYQLRTGEFVETKKMVLIR